MIPRAPNDVGGEPAGPMDTADHAKEPWEKQVDAILNLSRGQFFVDELRRHMESLGSVRYHEFGYTGRMLSALVQNHLVKGTITSDELARKLAEIEAREQAS